MDSFKQPLVEEGRCIVKVEAGEENKLEMKTSFILAVIFGLLVNCFAIELGEHQDHEHEHNNEHKHDHIEHEPDHNQNHDQDQDQEVREGKAEAFASDIESNFLESDNAGLAVDFSRFSELLQFKYYKLI